MTLNSSRMGHIDPEKTMPAEFRANGSGEDTTLTDGILLQFTVQGFTTDS